MSQANLKTLTIPRLQALLKAARARYVANSTCGCCGESFETLYGPLSPFAKGAVYLKSYYEEVKAELKRRQRR